MDRTLEDFLHKRRLHILLLVFLGLLVYSNTFDAPFQFDDYLFMEYRTTELKLTEAIAQLQEDRPEPDVVSVPTEASRGPWASRPLLYYSFVLNSRLGGFNSWGYHMMNIAFHLLNSILLYLLIIMTGKHLGREEKETVPMALLSATIFVLHPVETEAVNMVVNRSMLMLTTFYLFGMLSFLKAATSSGERKQFFIALILVSALLGAASREDFATFPVMLLVYDLFFVSKFRLREVLRHSREYTAALIGIAFLGYLVLTNTYDRPEEFSGQTLPSYLLIPHLQYALTQFKVHWTYIRLLLFPVNQNLDYVYPTARTLLTVPAMVSFIGYVGLWAAGLFLARRKPVVSFSLLWFLVILVPISFAVTLLDLRLGDVIFEHRFYLPSIGLIVLAAIALVSLAQKRRAVVPAVVAMCIAFGGAAYARNSLWTDSERLWSDVLAKSPGSHRAHVNLANILSSTDREDEAIMHIKEAMSLWPDNWKFYNNLGVAYTNKGEIETGIEYFEKTLEMEPDLAMAHRNLGISYMRQERYEEALEQFLIASKLEQWDTEALNSAAVASYALGRKEDAIKHYVSSLWLDKKQVNVLHNISVLYMETGQTDYAIIHLEALVDFVPEHFPAQFSLGKLYLEKDDQLKAIDHLEAALKLRPDDIESHRLLAKAYRGIGNEEYASKHQKIVEELEMSKKGRKTAETNSK